MFTTGSKFFFGLSAIAVVAAFVHGLATGDLAGVIVLAFTAVAAAFLGGVSSFVRDAEPRIGAGGVVAVPAAPNVSGSMWPLFGGVSGMLMGLGLAYDRRIFGVGLVLGLATIAEWMLRSWADRASSDPSFNAKVRGRLAHPVEFPVLGFAGIAAVLYGFSRILLSVNQTTAIVLFIAVGLAIFVTAIVLASRKHVSRTTMLGVGAGALGLLLAGAIVGVSRGEFHRVEAEKPNRAVAAKSSTFATVRASSAGIVLEHDSRTLDNIVLPKGVTANLLFRNETGGKAKLVVQTVKVEVDKDGNVTPVPSTYETEEIGDGKAKILNVKIPKPGKYKMMVEGESGAIGERDVEVLP